MKIRKLSIIALIFAMSMPVMSRRKLVPATQDVVVTALSDTLAHDTLDASFAPSLPPFRSDAVTIKGFNKRVYDNYETFFVQNNTDFHIAGITVTFKYVEVDGALLHERTLHVTCDLPAGKSKQVSVNSFDRQHMFYYYLSGQPRKSATPFKVTARLMGYDVSIMRPADEE